MQITRTPFGSECARLRLKTGTMLHEMADALGVTPSFVSSVETGRKQPPEIWVEKLARIFSLSESETAKLRSALLRSLAKYVIEVESESDRRIIVAFIENKNQIDADRASDIIDLIAQPSSKESRDET